MISEPGNFAKRIELGNLLLAGLHFKEAQERAQSVLAQDANNVDAHTLMANADEALGVTGEALKEMQTAVRLAPNVSKLYLNLARIQIDAKEFSAAEQSFQKAIRLDPKSTDALLSFGEFCAQQGRFAEAEKQFQAALQVEPKTPAAYRELAVLYDKLKQEAAGRANIAAGQAGDARQSRCL